MEQSNNREDEARTTAKKKLEFIRHLISYIIIIGALVIINNITLPDYQWWLWPAGGWGIAVILNFFQVYVFTGKKLEQKLYDKELEKMEDEE